MYYSKKDQQLINNTKGDFESYWTLPFAVYITNTEGRIIQANPSALKLFQLKELTPLNNIEHYYEDVRQRRRLIQEFEELPDKEWYNNQTILFRLKDRVKSLRFFAQVHRNTDGELLGMLTLVFQITEFEQFRELGQFIPAGFFQISSWAEVVYANEEFHRILGYQKGELKFPRKGFMFFKQEDEFKKIVEKLQRSRESLTLSNIKLQRKDGSSILTNIYIIPEHDRNGRLIGSKGLIKDITMEYIYKFVPIGLYMIEKKGQEDHFSWSNNTFEELYNLSESTLPSLIGQKVKDYYEDPIELERLWDAIYEAEKEGQPLLGYDLKLKNGKQVILNTRQIRDPEGNLEARVGAVFNVTKNVDHWTRELKQEIGGFLHTYSSMLVFYDKNFLNFGKSIGQSFFDRNRINIGQIENLLSRNVQLLGTEINNKILKADNLKISRINVVRIKEYLYRFTEKKGERLKTRAAWFRELALEFEQVIKDVLSSRLVPKDLDEIKHLNAEIIKYANLATVHHARVEIETMFQEIELMKEFIATGKFVFGRKKRINIIEVMNEVIESLSEYSRIQLVDLDLKVETKLNPYLEGNRQQLKIAIYNVVQNAIKYSFRKPEVFDYPFVSIRIKTTILKELEITVENRGVGIDELREIKNNRIFQFGVRGIHSKDKGRLGSGIGLFHTKKVIEHHRGSIEIQSVPIDTNSPNDFSKPFLTTVTIRLN